MEPAASAFPAIDAQSLSPAQEAAILYANGRSEDAERVLQQAIESDSGARGDPQPWELLFGLYRIGGQWERFAALAAGFEQTFGQPAPSWLSEESLAHLAAELREGGAAYAALTGTLDRRATAVLESLRERANYHGTVHIDATKITGVDAQGSESLVQTLGFLEDSDSAVLLTGAERLTGLLRQAVEAEASVAAYWSLLLELLRLRGLQSNFQRAALEYALATGTTPPVWRPMLIPVIAPPEIDEKRQEPRYRVGPESIGLIDALAGSGDSQLAALQAFAQERDYVNVDLSQLARMDLPAASALVVLVNGLSKSGKVVRLVRPNALVGALIESLRPDPRVQLVPTKPI